MTSILLIYLLIGIASAELVFVIAIWRHGDRAPGDLPYPNDPYNETFWPRGWNQLTNKGIEETYRLGQWFKQRYIDVPNALLTSDFHRKQVFIRSSDSERAVQSALSFTAGMYPCSGNLTWNSEHLRSWQPIPIHTNGYGRKDPLLKPTSIECSEYSRTVELENAEILDKLSVEYDELFRMFSNYSGMIIDISNVKGLYDMHRERTHSLEQPAWIYEKWNGTALIDHIIELKRITRNLLFNSTQKSRLRGGYLVNDWITRLQEAANDSASHKAVLYSSHDGTIMALSHAMGISNHQIQPYCATYIAELHRNGSQHHVKLLYKNGTETLHRLRLPNCTEDCPLEEFATQLETMRVCDEQHLQQLCSSTCSVKRTGLVLISTMIFIQSML